MDVNIYTLCRYRFPKQKNDKWRFILLSTNQCAFQVMVQNALFATLMVNSVMFDSAWQLWCTLVNLDLMSCQKKKCGLVVWACQWFDYWKMYLCLYNPFCASIWNEPNTVQPLYCIRFRLQVHTWKNTIISQGNSLDLRPDSLCQVVPAEITDIA